MSHDYSFFLLLMRRPQISTLFPYTTLFRSIRIRDSKFEVNANRRAVVLSCADPSAFPEAPHGEGARIGARSEEHTSELQSLRHLVCRLLLEKKKEARRKPNWIWQLNK